MMPDLEKYPQVRNIIFEFMRIETSPTMTALRVVELLNVRELESLTALMSTFIQRRQQKYGKERI